MIDEQAFIDFTCPHCGDPLSFPQADIGHARDCPNCMEPLVVPEAGSEIGRKLPLPLATERLTLRRFTGADWKDLVEIMSDEDSFRYTLDAPMDEDRVLQWLEAERAVRVTTLNQWFNLGLELKESGKLIGYIALAFQEFEAMLFIRLHQSYQKKALALEAVEAVLGFCFEGIKLHRVAAECDSRNEAACRLCENVGLRREGEFLKDKQVNGEWANTVHYAALETEYLDPTKA